MGSAYSYFGIDDPNEKKKTITQKESDPYSFFGLEKPPVQASSLATTQPEFHEDTSTDFSKYLTTSHAVSVPIAQPTQPSTWDQIKAGDIKGLPGQVGLGLAHGLSRTGAVKQNADIANMLTKNPLPGMADLGKQQLTGIQASKSYLEANPVNSFPAMLGEQVPQIPLWMAGEGAVGVLGKGLSKLSPALASTANKVGSKIPSFIKGGLTDAATYSGVVSPVENIQQNGTWQDLINREKQVPTIALGGAVARGAFKGIGEGISGVKSLVKPLGVPAEPYGPMRPSYNVQRKTGLGPLKSNDALTLEQGAKLSAAIKANGVKVNPLEDVQNAYKPPTLENIKSEELRKSAVKYDAGVDKTPSVINPIPDSVRNTKQGELQKLFNDLPNQGKYSFTTSEQRAMSELQDGIQAAQNYIGHTDVLAGYPQGTTISQAYDDIAKNTGVNLPELISKWEKAQSTKNVMAPQERSMGRAAGIIPDLAPRKSWTSMVPQEVMDAPIPTSVRGKPLTWTNKEGIPVVNKPVKSGEIPKRVDVPSKLEIARVGDNKGINRRGYKEEWGTYNQYLEQNPYRKSMDEFHQKYPTPESRQAHIAEWEKILGPSKQWEMSQILNGKPAYLENSLTPEMEIFAKDHNLPIGKVRTQTGNMVGLVARDTESFNKVAKAITNNDYSPLKQRELGLALGYQDVSPIREKLGTTKADGVVMDPKLVASRKIVNENIFWNKVKSESKWQGDIPSLQEGIKSGKVSIDELPPEMAKEVRLKMNLQMFGASADPILPEPQSKIIIGKQKEKINFKNAWDKFYTAIVNTQQPIANAAKVTGSDIGKLASNTKNVSGIIDHNFLTALVDKRGNKVGESLKSTVEAIPNGQEEKFWTYMSQRHNIDRAAEVSHQVPKVDKQGFLVKNKDGNQVYDKVIDKKPTPVQANYTSKMSRDAVRIAERDNPEYKAIGDGIVKWLDSFMNTWGVDTGIVNKEIYAGLRKTYKSYFPTQRDFSELEKSISDNVSQKFANQRTPIRKATGSERDIKDPIENIMNLVDRTIRTAKYNEVGQSLLSSVREAPEKLNPLAEVIPTKDGMFSNLDNIITVLEDGKPVYLKINDKMLLDAMNGLPKSIGNIPILSTLTNGFKSLITQKNPLFAIRNIFRDIPTSYVYGSESNPFKFGKGLLSAGKDVLTNSPRLQKYKAVGGGGGNFFSNGDVTKSAAELMDKGSMVKKIAMKPIKAIESFNTLTETIPRLAEFNRVLDKTNDITKALYSANDVTVNFSRGGNITKNVDKITPYANAGVQGLDRFFRGFSSPKVALATMAKAGVAITVPDVALYMINRDNPNYQALDNRTKDSYFLIPKEGGKTFIKVPKSRELGVLFGSLFERSMRAAEGQKEPLKGFRNTVATNFSPANPIDSNFFSPATWNIATNRDFANRAIVPQGMLMDKRSKYLQYDDKTTQIAKEIGKLSTDIPGLPSGISPKQLDYLVKSYSGVIGQFGTPLLVPGGSPGKVLSTQFSSDPKFSNQATTDFYDKLDKLSAAAVDKNIIEKIPAKKLTKEEDIKNSMVGVSAALSRGTKQINKIQASSDPDKESKINTIKTQMLQLTMKANSAKDAKEMQRVETYSKKFFIK